MKVEQWALSVPKKKGEATRQHLVANGLLDASLKPFVEGDGIFFPLTRSGGGGLRASFEAHEKRVSPAARHELIGGIAVMEVGQERGNAIVPVNSLFACHDAGKD